jgi:hypothetical protein
MLWGDVNCEQGLLCSRRGRDRLPGIGFPPTRYLPRHRKRCLMPLQMILSSRLSARVAVLPYKTGWMRSGG